MSHRRGRSVVGAVVVAAFVLSGCGDDSDSSTSSAPVTTSQQASSAAPAASSPSSAGTTAPAPVPAASSAAASKSPVLVGALVDETGTASGDRARLAKVLPAWQKFVNAHGGLGGHPVTLDIRDTTSDAATAQAAASSLIAKQPVAIYLDSSATESAIAQSLGASGIPILGVGYSPAVWGAKLTSLGV